MKRLRGLVAATFTPMHEDGSLHLERVGAIVEHLLGQHLSGIFLCGSTGEGESLTAAERRLVAEAYMEAVGGRLPVIVQVGHNCRVGRGVIMAAQVGLSGSVRVGDGAVLAGQAGVADHVQIGAGAQLGGQAGANRDLPGGQRWMGTPAMPLGTAARVFAARKQLPELLRRVRRLEKELQALRREASSLSGKLLLPESDD